MVFEMKPLVSVIMPAYNCELFIKQAIDSILNQTYQNFELIISDDASQDDTWEVINSFEDKRIIKSKNDLNRGLLKNFNYCLTQVRGDYVTCQDADDWSEPTRLEEQLNVFHEIPDIHLVGCNGGFYYNERSKHKCPPFKSGYVSVEQEIQPFILPAILYKKEVLAWIPGFHPYFDKATSMDQYFVFNILSKYKGYAIDKYLYTHRFNYSSSTRNLDNFRKATAHEAYLLLRQQRLATGSDWLIEGRDEELLNFERSLLNDKVFMSEKFREYAVYKIDGGYLKDGFYLLQKSFMKNPFYGKFYRTLFYWFKKLLKLR